MEVSGLVDICVAEKDHFVDVDNEERRGEDGKDEEKKYEKVGLPRVSQFVVVFR